MGHACVSAEDEAVANCDGNNSVDGRGGSSGSESDIRSSSEHNSTMVVSGRGTWRSVAGSAVFSFGGRWAFAVG